jgi:hypothetical protein
MVTAIAQSATTTTRGATVYETQTSVCTAHISETKRVRATTALPAATHRARRRIVLRDFTWALHRNQRSTWWNNTPSHTKLTSMLDLGNNQLAVGAAESQGDKRHETRHCSHRSSSASRTVPRRFYTQNMNETTLSLVSVGNGTHRRMNWSMRRPSFRAPNTEDCERKRDVALAGSTIKAIVSPYSDNNIRKGAH